MPFSIEYNPHPSEDAANFREFLIIFYSIVGVACLAVCCYLSYLGCKSKKKNEYESLESNKEDPTNYVSTKKKKSPYVSLSMHDKNKNNNADDHNNANNNTAGNQVPPAGFELRKY